MQMGIGMRSTPICMAVVTSEEVYQRFDGVCVLGEKGVKCPDLYLRSGDRQFWMYGLGYDCGGHRDCAVGFSVVYKNVGSQE